MISFKQFFLESMMQIPVAAMGMSRREDPLPDKFKKRPYGFWVDKSGNYLPVDSHLRGGIQMIKGANNWRASQNPPLPPFDVDLENDPDVYDFFFSKGWLRVVLSGNSLFGEIAPGYKTSDHQEDFVNKVRHQYGLSRHPSRF